jgi:hypothetical protein
MKEISDTTYHRVLRVASVVCAVALLFESGIISPVTRQLSVETHQYLANAVGVGAAVEPTELNSLTSELTKQKLALQAREQQITEREIEIGLAAGQSANQTSTYVLSGVLFILLVLIILNYTLDYLRARELRTPQRQQTV